MVQNGGFVSMSDRNMTGTVDRHQIMENLECQIEVVPCSKKQRDAELESEDLTWRFMYPKLEGV